MRFKRKYIILPLTVLLFAILFYCIDLQEASKTLRQSNPLYLLFSFFLMCTFPFWCALRWNIIVSRMGIRLGLWQSFIIIMAAWPLGTITPAKSGDLIKVLFLKNVLPYAKTTGVIISERMLDLIALSLYGTVGSVLLGFYTTALFTGVILAGVILFFILAASPLVNRIPEKWRDLSKDILESSKEIYLHWGSFSGLLLITLINWMSSFLQTWCCYKAFYAEVPISFIVATLPIAIFIGVIPITLSGMGTRDSAMIYLFRSYASYETNLAVGILYSIFGYWLLALIGIPFMKSALGGSIKDIRGELLSKEILNRS